MPIEVQINPDDLKEPIKLVCRVDKQGNGPDYVQLAEFLDNYTRKNIKVKIDSDETLKKIPSYCAFLQLTPSVKYTALNLLLLNPAAMLSPKNIRKKMSKIAFFGKHNLESIPIKTAMAWIATLDPILEKSSAKFMEQISKTIAEIKDEKDRQLAKASGSDSNWTDFFQDKGSPEDKVNDTENPNPNPNRKA